MSAGRDAEFLAQAVEAEIVRRQGIHEVEMNFPRAHVEGACIDHVLPDLRRRFAGEIVRFEIAQALHDLIAALVPDRWKILQERRQHGANSLGTAAGDPGRDRNVGAIDENSGNAWR